VQRWQARFDLVMPTNAKARSTQRKPRNPRAPRRARPPAKLRALANALRKFALSFPGAREDYPWGERVVKGANNKVFVFLGDPYMISGELGFTVKLPESRKELLRKAFAKPCGYGLGKHGWVTVRFGAKDRVPTVKTMTGWITESHAAVNGSTR
jgi:predicted DNA-binding protein (MmcQ/YjbR family)